MTVIRWKDLTNNYRTKWNIPGVPTLVRYESVDGTVKETGRLGEEEMLDEKTLSKFIGNCKMQGMV